MTVTSNWTDERTDILVTMRSDGHTFSDIGRKLGMSRGAVAGKASRMNLPEPGEMAPVKPELPLRLVLRNIEWSRTKCVWPSGDPQFKDEFHFCGKPVETGKPYCSEHCNIAYTTSRDGS